MTDPTPLAELLHDDWCIHFDPAEFSIPPVPMCEQRAARLIAAGVVFPSVASAPLPTSIEWEDVVDGLEVALSYPAEMEVNRERWRAARVAILDLWDSEYADVTRSMNPVYYSGDDPSLATPDPER